MTVRQKALAVALNAISGQLLRDPSEGGPQDWASIADLSVAADWFRDELMREGGKVSTGVVTTAAWGPMTAHWAEVA